MSDTDTGRDTGVDRTDPGEQARSEEETAGAQLSTAPGEDRLRVPSLGPLGWARWFWRQLTSMRVALILLFLLSLAAVPGSLVPQNQVDVVKVEDFQKRHETLTPLYEKLQLFDVYGSVWFSAIYILLFVSLAGCIVPRSWQFVGQLRGRPPKAPRRLDRMPASTSWHTDAPPERVLEQARTLLRGRRFRVEPGSDSVAAEKGYLREAGNLAFHVALIVMLLAFAAGQLWKSEGGKLIVQGDGFSNTLTQYDDFKSGSLYDPEDLDHFGFRLDKFTATFEESGPSKGTARTFRADVSYWTDSDGKEHRAPIEVNHPLQVGDTKVYLLSRGFAPIVRVTDGQGDVAYRGPVPFIPQDNNQTSSGVIKVTDYRNAKGFKDQLGFQGFFVPDFAPNTGTMFSQSPTARNPVLFLTAYRGDLGLNAGSPQNVYQLDTKNLKQFKAKGGKPLAKQIAPGGTMKLPNGAGTLKFEGYKKWASFQISQQPGKGWALGGAVAAVIGLAASLFIQRRRVWVRARTTEDGRTLVEMAGLGRSESTRLPEELGDLAQRLAERAPLVPAPSDTSEDTTEGTSKDTSRSSDSDGDSDGDRNGTEGGTSEEATPQDPAETDDTQDKPTQGEGARR
ncbi:cytochrome c biogenesis protein ResB [Streptomyces sp. NPDC005438]|uniref:cytochrome c biogenesis protein ResB n=1 Tax=Streptomyces sp. NPDC005438 TaxID=3156880 RepID=UPI0033B30CBA